MKQSTKRARSLNVYVIIGVLATCNLYVAPGPVSRALSGVLVILAIMALRLLADEP